ncbi:MAG: class I SAM-dependent methyltransferase [Vicinamibacterales bacterium]
MMPRIKSPLPWLRFPNEVSSCPGCRSSTISLIDAFRPRAKADERRVAFLTGCRSCGLLFANPLPTAEQLHHTYSKAGPWAAAREERLSRLANAHQRRERKALPTKARSVVRGPDLLLEALASYLPVHNPPLGAKVLDFGCGDGKFLNRLQDRGWETHGIELSTDVAFLRHRRLKSPPQDASFDFVVLHHVLEHVRTPLEILEQLALTLREGGVMFISTPRLDTLPDHRDLPYCIDGRRHILSFSERCLAGLLTRAGFHATARLDLPVLDRLQTDGKQLRLRIVATRTLSPSPLPSAPLAPALAALRRYGMASNSDPLRHLLRFLPVRMRAALLARVRKTSRHRAHR